MTTFEVTHRTEYRYGAPVSASYGEACLVPRELPAQRCLASQLSIVPHPSDQRNHQDFFGNTISYFSVDDPHTELVVTSTSTVEVDRSPDDPIAGGDEPWESVRDRCREMGGPLGVEARHDLLSSPRAPTTEQSADYAAGSFVPNRPVLDAVVDLVHRIHSDFDFDTDASDVRSTIDDLFLTGAGVCQDFAHLAVSCLRAVGLPARYVSGYLETSAPPGRPKLVGVDVSHAWASVLLPEAGWIGIDPTNDQLADGRYVTVGWGRDYRDVAPIRGVIYSDSTSTQLRVEVDVRRVDSPS